MSVYQIGWMAMRVLGFAFFVVCIVRFAAGARSRRGSGHDLLRERLAKGEIDADEYRRLRDAMDS
jgi:uncharacterized membrane protein